MGKSMTIRQGRNRIKLSKTKLQALKLRAFDRLSYEEIAERQGVNPQTAYLQVKNAIGIIQTACEDELRICHE